MTREHNPRRNRLTLVGVLIGLSPMLAPAALPRAQAQEVAPPPTPNADRLAAQMRILAADPRNVDALLTAGELSARLADPAAAAGFFARAQALQPGNPRVMAGQAMAMVRMERPGEALRLFAAAERGGLAMRAYASDRGLAYDLIGAQAHAQREHRVAMQDDPDDETIRRFALSLGINGQTEEAMRALDPLLRRSDRAAWRARAFILAMNGDAAGADKIAASMMGGFGTALSPFFRRLPALAPADKAFAVHFGELRRTPARLADARLAPALPQLPPERLASAPPPPPRAAEPVARPARDRGARAVRDASARAETPRREREELAARRATEEAEARRLAEARAAQERETERLAEAQRQAEARRLAEERAAQEREALAARQREAERVAAAERATREAEQTRLAAAATPAPAPVVSQPAPVEVARAPDPAPPPASAAAGTPPRVGGEDSVIARIVAGITIPASELGVEPMPGRDEPEVAVAAAPPVPEPVAAKPEPAPKPTPPAAKKAEPAAKKAAPPAKPKIDPAKAEPARHWAQVAGGANVRALPREWKRLAAEAPAEFRGKQAWTTPLRFTNRLLVGPFKTADAAQDFVNAIAKKGLSGFSWTSEAGQKIEKLDVK